LTFEDSPRPQDREQRDHDQAGDDVPRVVKQGRDERPQVVGHREGGERDREDVVEGQRPAREERDDLVEGVARERRRPPGLGIHRRALGIALGGNCEEQAGGHEDHRRETERVDGDEPEGVIDR
jgi:hypothetical protein